MAVMATVTVAVGPPTRGNGRTIHNADTTTTTTTSGPSSRQLSTPSVAPSMKAPAFQGGDWTGA